MLFQKSLSASHGLCIADSSLHAAKRRPKLSLPLSKPCGMFSRVPPTRARKFGRMISISALQRQFELENLTVVARLTWEQVFETYKDNHNEWRHLILKLLGMHFYKITIRASCKQEDTGTERHPVWNSWIVRPFIARLNNDIRRAPAVRILEYDCSATLNCPRARRHQFSGTYLREITNTQIWKIDLLITARFEKILSAFSR
jgi:hypothetical protein